MNKPQLSIRWNKTIDGAAQYLLDTADDFDRVEREIGALLDSSMQGELPFAVFDEGGIGGGLDHTADNPTEPPGLSELYEQVYSMRLNSKDRESSPAKRILL